MRTAYRRSQTGGLKAVSVSLEYNPLSEGIEKLSGRYVTDPTVTHRDGAEPPAVDWTIGADIERSLLAMDVAIVRVSWSVQLNKVCTEYLSPRDILPPKIGADGTLLSVTVYRMINGKPVDETWTLSDGDNPVYLPKVTDRQTGKEVTEEYFSIEPVGYSVCPIVIYCPDRRNPFRGAKLFRQAVATVALMARVTLYDTGFWRFINNVLFVRDGSFPEAQNTKDADGETVSSVYAGPDSVIHLKSTGETPADIHAVNTTDGDIAAIEASISNRHAAIIDSVVANSIRGTVSKQVDTQSGAALYIRQADLMTSRQKIDPVFAAGDRLLMATVSAVSIAHNVPTEGRVFDTDPGSYAVSYNWVDMARDDKVWAEKTGALMDVGVIDRVMAVAEYHGVSPEVAKAMVANMGPARNTQETQTNDARTIDRT
jgi:hypothetical protein